MRKMYSEEQIKQLAGGLYEHSVHNNSGLIIAHIITTSPEKCEFVKEFSNKIALKYQGFLLPFDDVNFVYVYKLGESQPVRYDKIVQGSTFIPPELKGCTVLATKNAEGNPEVIDFGEYSSIGKEIVERL